MSGNDPKETDSVETGAAQETSRRDLLAAGAAAVVGATTAAVIPRSAKANHLTASGVHNADGTEVPNPGHSGDNLAAMMVKAWKTPNFRARILVANHNDLKMIMQGENVPNPPNKPKMIDQAQFIQGYVREVGEVVYLLPDEPNIGGSPVSPKVVARVLMAAVPFGM